MEIKANSITSMDFKSVNKARHFKVIMDNTPENGGGDTGGTPKEHLCMALGSCTNMTLKAFLDRKKWRYKEILSDTHFYTKEGQSFIDLDININGKFEEDQIRRLYQIAHLCPIHKVLSKGCEIQTKINCI